MKPPRGGYVIRDARAVRLLASPLRQAMLDFIVADGAATVAELSERLKRPADRLYYHVRLMQRAGLLLGQTPNGTGRIEERFDVPGRPMMLEYDRSTTAKRRAVTHVISAALRTARGDFASALASDDTSTSGPRRELWAGRVEASLSPEEVKTFNAELQKLMSRFRTEPGRDNPVRKSYQFTWAFSPTRT